MLCLGLLCVVYICVGVLGIEPKTACMLGKHFNIELHSQPLLKFLKDKMYGISVGDKGNSCYAWENQSNLNITYYFQNFSKQSLVSLDSAQI